MKKFGIVIGVITVVAIAFFLLYKGTIATWNDAFGAKDLDQALLVEAHEPAQDLGHDSDQPFVLSTDGETLPSATLTIEDVNVLIAEYDAKVITPRIMQQLQELVKEFESTEEYSSLGSISEEEALDISIQTPGAQNASVNVVVDDEVVRPYAPATVDFSQPIAVGPLYSSGVPTGNEYIRTEPVVVRSSNVETCHAPCY